MKSVDTMGRLFDALTLWCAFMCGYLVARHERWWAIGIFLIACIV